MPEPDPVAVLQLIPILHVRDVEAAAAWYRDVRECNLRDLDGNDLHVAQELSP